MSPTSCRACAWSARPAAVSRTVRVVRSNSAYTQFPFQRADRRTQRGLGHVQFLGGAREVTSVRHRQELLQSAHLH